MLSTQISKAILDCLAKNVRLDISEIPVALDMVGARDVIAILIQKLAIQILDIVL